MTIEMKAPLNASSHIKSLGYDAETQTMAVEFHKGGLFHYPGVPSNIFDTMQTHDSPGSFFHQHVRGKYQHQKR